MTLPKILFSIAIFTVSLFSSQGKMSESPNSSIYTTAASSAGAIYKSTTASQANADITSTNLTSPVSIAEKPLSPTEQLGLTLSSMQSDAVMRNANWGFVVYDPKSKKVINSYNENQPLVPASTTKLLTTETAFSLLGTGFQWLTRLEYSGVIDENGVLNGNLYLIGSGDPSLGTSKAGATSYGMISMDFVAALAEKGIKKVNGNIIVQTAVFKINKNPNLPENIVWLDQGSYYLPMGSTKDIDPSKEKLIVKQKNPFDAPVKRYFYMSPYIKKMVYTEDYNPTVLHTKIPDPPVSLANSLRLSMIKSGIAITGKVENKIIDNQLENRMLVTSYRSPDLNDVVYYTNQHSDNGLAEAILRMVGFQKLGDQSLESGKKVVTEHLLQDGFDTQGFSYIDGSGLSRANTVTPMAQVKFLSSIMNEKYFKNYFDSLPIAGQSGTLKKMFVYNNGNGQIFAKTGTLNKVKCLSGYIKTYSGRILTFSLLVNNFSGSVDMVKKRMEMILEPTLSL